MSTPIASEPSSGSASPARIPRHLLFVRTDRLGETVLALPAIHALRAAYPQARLTMMVNPALQPLLAGHPDLDEVVSEPATATRWWQQACRLAGLWRSWRVDTVIIANPTKAYHLASWLAGIRCRVGYDRKWGGLLNRRLPDRKALGAHHELEYNLDLVAALGIPVPTTPVLRLPIRPDDDGAVERFLSLPPGRGGEPLVAVHPWTSNARKQWPLDRVHALLTRLTQDGRVRVIVIGGLEERAQVSVVMQGLTQRVIDGVGRLSLRELAALLRRARVLVTNDSGPMHVAAAVGGRVVALFGTAAEGSCPTRWGPWGSGHTVIEKPLTHIAVEEVLAAVRPYLGPMRQPSTEATRAA